jgi:hypothetical protein
MWTVYSIVENRAYKVGDSSYGDKLGTLVEIAPPTCPQRKEKIFSGLRDK